MDGEFLPGELLHFEWQLDSNGRDGVTGGVGTERRNGIDVIMARPVGRKYGGLVYR